MIASTLEGTVTDIVVRIRQGRYPNEQSICQGIVLRLLQDLGWETYDTTSVWPEYQTGEGRAEFALCHPPSEPSVFIEVKQPGRVEQYIRQALEYVFNIGDIALTAGNGLSSLKRIGHRGPNRRTNNVNGGITKRCRGGVAK